MYCNVIRKLYLVFLKPGSDECQKVNTVDNSNQIPLFTAFWPCSYYYISEMRREPLQMNNEVSSTSNPHSELGNKPNCITTDIGLRKSTRVKKPASEGQNDFLWESDMKK